MVGTTDIDLNALAAGFLSDLSALQTIKPKKAAFARACEIVMRLEAPLDALLGSNGKLQSLPGIGPSSERVILEVIQSGHSPTVEQAVAASGRTAEIAHARAVRVHFLSRVQVVRLLGKAARGAVGLGDYRGDFQMHSTWSDGRPTLAQLAEACASRGYEHFAVTDHSHGLASSASLSMGGVAGQHAEIDRVNAAYETRIRIIKGVEANLQKDGSLDVPDEDLRRFEMVLAAPHSQLRESYDQTPRLVRAVSTRGVHILAHGRGRQFTGRAGVIAHWDEVFGAAAEHRVAIEIDGDPNRQDLDHTLARRAHKAGCLLALDSDAHGVDELNYADTAVAHARLAGIPASRIVNCWPFAKLSAWLAERRDGA